MREVCLILGPTGVGKSDFALALATAINGEIINCDVGQLYVPLTIGTAKPAWRQEKIPHHLFDILSEPIDYTVVAYRQAVAQCIAEIRSRGKTPLIVGGSLFYAQALFFPPCDVAQLGAPDKLPVVASDNFSAQELPGTTEQLWEELFHVDPERARVLHKNDRYRIERALLLWHKTGVRPSRCKPQFSPIMPNWHIYYLTRDRAELYSRINARTLSMIYNEGWKQEVATLAPSWHPFVRKKGLIGYGEILDALPSRMSDEVLIAKIQQETRHYAKRQETFWRSMKRRLDEQIVQGACGVCDELNLTFLNVDLYIRQLQARQ